MLGKKERESLEAYFRCPCFNHQLHLVVVHVIAGSPQVEKYFGLCDALYNVLWHPAISVLYDGGKFKCLLDQRWSGHLATTVALLDNFSWMSNCCRLVLTVMSLLQLLVVKLLDC